MEVTITKENFAELKAGNLPLVVDFWATKQYDGKIVVGKCDVEDNEELAAEFGIRNIPTILFFKNGEVVDKLIGAQSKAKFEEKFEAML